jgi:DNA-binding NtrC family response regulator
VKNVVKEPILVVDDDLDFLDLVSTLLMDEGYDVDSAKSGQEAIEKCIENYYSLILIDVKLPDFEGTQLLTRISDTDPKMRKIIITGYPRLENARHAIDLGANAYLIKPVKVEELLETVRKQVSERNKEFSERYSLLESLNSKEKE